MVRYGRKPIFTDVPEITSDNVIEVLREAIVVHDANANRINYLLDYEAGIQPLQRVKTYRPEIDVQDIDNVANEITDFKLGFKWGSPITLTQRGNVDSGKTDEPLSIALMNEQYHMCNIAGKRQELARYIEITGVGYTYVDINTRWKKGKAYFTVDVLDPATTFVIRSNYYSDKRIVAGVTFRQDNKGNRYYTVFTDTTRFEIINLTKIKNGRKIVQKDSWNQDIRSGEENPLGMIPIIEWLRAYDRMGCFERLIDDMDSLNILESDIINDVDQNTQSIWHANDVTTKEDENGNRENPKSGNWVYTYTTKTGKTPFITPLNQSFDYGSISNFALSKRALILQKACVPQRNDNSGGSTGIAMSDATGWSAAENSASKEELITRNNVMAELEVALEAIKISPDIEPDNPLLKLDAYDCDVSIKRHKTYELTTKANFMATLLSHGFYGEDVINAADAFDDNNQVWVNSREGITKYQETIYNKGNEAQGGTDEQAPNADRISQDRSDQESNSPMMN